MKLETYKWVKRCIPRELQKDTIARINKRENTQRNLIKGIRENGKYAEFVMGSADIHEFLKAISINNKRFELGKSKYKVVIFPQHAIKDIDGKKYSGFDMTCVPSL